MDFEELDKYADRIVALYAEAEDDIIADMVERIAGFDMYIDAVQFQEQKLQEMGLSHQNIVARLAKAAQKSEREIEIIIASSQAGILDSNHWLRDYGYNLTSERAAEIMRYRLAAGLKKTNLLFENLTATTANTATRQFERALDRAYMRVETGAFSYSESIRRAVKELAGQGIQTVEYHNGFKTKRTDKIDVAVRRAVLTGVNQTTAAVQLDVNAELGLDLVEVSAHEGARPDHAEWQGKIYSLSGTSKKYKDFYSATGYGTGAGLCGWNCRHTFYPYVEGANRVWTEDRLTRLKSRTVVYNGERYTEYQATQIQRGIERQIRKYKREANALNVAGLDNGAEREKVAFYNNKLNDFTRQTGFKKQYDRTFVGEYNAQKQTPKKVAPKATQPEKINTKIDTDLLLKVRAANIKPLETEKYEQQPTMVEIVKMLGGADRTLGSCSSLAFAYAGNRNGIKVRDFRNGKSREFFALNDNIHKIVKNVGGSVKSNASDYVSANALLETVEEGKEYYFSAGKHAAIVRRKNGILEYLELQTSNGNGWHDLTQEELKDRFGCKRSHTWYGTKYNIPSSLADVKNFKDNDEFNELLKYINTEEGKQAKGYGGGKK